MLRKLPLIPERRLRVFAAVSRVAEGVLIQVLRIGSGKPPWSGGFTPSQFYVTTRNSGPGGPMKRNRKLIEAVATLLLTTLFSASAIPISEAANKPKAAGRTSNTIPNTILNGKGAPLSSVGINGDFYIDTRSLLIYGPKKSNKWPLPQNLQGPIGAAGVDGKNGSEGKTISSASTVAGPVGTQGEKGDKGEKGDAGSAGASGLPGSAGLTGSKGDTGLTGATGAPGGGSGTPGATGAQGPIGNTGSVGATGARGETGTAGSAGIKGETGTVGATGPSNVYTNSIPTWNLSTTTPNGYSTSSLFLNYKASKNYIYTIYLVGLSNASGGVFAIEMIHSDGSSSTFGYSVAENLNFTGEAKSTRYTFTITGVISPVGGDVGVAIRVIDDSAVTGASNAMAFSGVVFSTLVGSVGAL